MTRNPTLEGWSKSPPPLINSACPVTCGQPTTMLRGTFAKICARYQEEFDSCCRFICGGKWPPAGLVLIESLKKFESKEKAMVAATLKGKCELCGDAGKNLKKVKGKACCSVCEFIWRAAHNTPALMVSTLEEVQGAEYLKGKIGIPVGDQQNSSNDDFEQATRRAFAAETIIDNVRSQLGCTEDGSIIEDVAQLKEKMAALSTLANQQAVEIQDYIDRLSENKPDDANDLYTLNELRDLVAGKEKDLANACAHNETLRGDISAMQERISSLSDELNTIREITVTAARNAVVICGYPLNEELPIVLRRVIHHYEQQAKTSLPSLSIDTNGRDTALLELALGALAGKITGLDADLISSLR